MPIVRTNWHCLLLKHKKIHLTISSDGFYMGKEMGDVGARAFSFPPALANFDAILTEERCSPRFGFLIAVRKERLLHFYGEISPGLKAYPSLACRPCHFWLSFSSLSHSPSLESRSICATPRFFSLCPRLFSFHFFD